MTTETRVAETRSNYLIWFADGLALRVSPVLNPIHELMHMVLVETFGGEVVKLNWSSVVWRNVPQVLIPLVVAGAYWMETGLYLAIAMIRKGRAPVVAGILPAVYVSALISEDFARSSIENLVAYAILGLILCVSGIYYALMQTKEAKIAQARQKPLCR